MTGAVTSVVRLTICYVLLLGLITAMADAGWLSDLLDRVHQVPGGDKALHFALVGVLALLVNASTLRENLLSGPLAIVAPSLVIAAVATFEELSNLAVPGRNCCLGDLAANYLGIFCVGVLPLVVSSHWVVRRFEVRPPWQSGR
jgi:hypothetical protein